MRTLRGHWSGGGQTCILGDHRAAVDDVDGIGVRIHHGARFEGQHGRALDGQVPRKGHVAAPRGVGHDGCIRSTCRGQGRSPCGKDEEQQQSGGSTTHAFCWSLTHIKSTCR